MTDLRKIAEALSRDSRRSYLTVEWAGNISALLDAVVRERAELIARSDENIEITLKQAKIKALKELGLKGVWPGKKG